MRHKRVLQVNNLAVGRWGTPSTNRIDVPSALKNQASCSFAFSRTNHNGTNERGGPPPAGMACLPQGARVTNSRHVWEMAGRSPFSIKKEVGNLCFTAAEKGMGQREAVRGDAHCSIQQGRGLC